MAPQSIIKLIIASFVLSLSACTGELGSPPKQEEEDFCEPGTYVFCRCASGESGTKECLDSADKFGPCNCDGAGGGGSGWSTGGSSSEGGSAAGGAEPSSDVLLIPDRDSDSVGMYSPLDGSYLGDFVPPPTGSEPYEFQAPMSAVQGPDGRIYVSDQLADSIFAFNLDGSFDGVFADSTDGLDNIRGMDVYGGELYVAVNGSQGAFVARFAMDGTRLADHVADDSGAFDILFRPDGVMLMANTNDPDNVRRYSTDGQINTQLLEASFPHQLQMKDGVYLLAAWSGDSVMSFDEIGVLQAVQGLPDATGVYPLDNGNWLVTSNDGVQEINPNATTLEVVYTHRAGVSHMFIERVTL